MTDAVQTIPSTLPASAAWELMHRLGVHHLVVKEGSAIAGVLSDRDLGSGRHTAGLDGYRAGDLMTGNVVTITETETVRHAANLMRGRSIGCLPVTREGRLVGIVTVSDLLVLLGRGIDRPAPSGRRNLQHRGPHKHNPSRH